MCVSGAGFVLCTIQTEFERGSGNRFKIGTKRNINENFKLESKKIQEAEFGRKPVAGRKWQGAGRSARLPSRGFSVCGKTFVCVCVCDSKQVIHSLCVCVWRRLEINNLGTDISEIIRV